MNGANDGQTSFVEAKDANGLSFRIPLTEHPVPEKFQRWCRKHAGRGAIFLVRHVEMEMKNGAERKLWLAMPVCVECLPATYLEKTAGTTRRDCLVSRITRA